MTQPEYYFQTQAPFVLEVFDNLCISIYRANRDKGFWDNRLKQIADNIGQDDCPEVVMTVKSLIEQMPQRNFGETIALIMSELGESMEAHRKSLPDDKLPQYPGAVVELIDAVIRLCDWLGYWAETTGGSPAKILLEKLSYNTGRPYKHGKEY